MCVSADYATRICVCRRSHLGGLQLDAQRALKPDLVERDAKRYTWYTLTRKLYGRISEVQPHLHACGVSGNKHDMQIWRHVANKLVGVGGEHNLHLRHCTVRRKIECNMAGLTKTTAGACQVHVVIPEALQ